jgi:hypothetical protein
MDGIMTEDEARAILTPYHDQLYASIARGLGRWREIETAFARPESAVRHQVIHQFQIEEIRSRFGDAPGIALVEPRKGRQRVRGGLGRRRPEDAGRFLLSFGGRLVVQFKKLDPEFRTRNYSTRRSNMFNAQQPLNGIPAGTRLTFGYRLNATAQELVTVAVVCQGPVYPRWHYELGVEAPMEALSPLAPLQPAQVLPKGQMDLPATAKKKQ